MNKTILSLCVGLLTVSVNSQAQLAFWNYDENNQEMAIPTECDGVFDENRGGVYLPTAEEMFEKGEEFLITPDPVERNKAGFCLIGAAVQGYLPAQYRVAQLYAKGIILPQDDLSAYRWAFLAALQGHPDAERLALLLERFLTTAEIEKATASIPGLIPDVSKHNQAELDEKTKIVQEKQAELEQINNEIDSLLGIKVKKSAPPKAPTQEPSTPVQQAIRRSVPQGSIFSDKDRL